MTAVELDQDRAAQFTGKVLSDSAACFTTVLSAIGDRLGLFRSLAADGPATARELAARTATDARYVEEWLAQLHAAGYVTYDPSDQRCTLPAEHWPTLVAEPGPAFFGGVHQEMWGILHRLDGIESAFRHGGGVRYADFPPDTFEGMTRFTTMWHENLLLQDWVPRVPAVQAKLDAGCRVADVGCGQGRALLKLAQAFPAGTYVGFDALEYNVERARANAREVGLDDRVEYRLLDAAQGLPGRYDVVTTFDVVHDSVDPLGVLRSIRDALDDDGIYLCLDIRCSDRLEDNIGPVAALLYGFSVTCCMTVSLAEGGRGLGTMGLPLSTLRELATDAGFRSVDEVAMDNPFNSLFEVRP